MPSRGVTGKGLNVSRSVCEVPGRAEMVPDQVIIDPS